MKVENFTAELAEKKRTVNLPLRLKQIIRVEILQRLKTLPANTNATEQRGWCRLSLFVCIILFLTFCISLCIL